MTITEINLLRNKQDRIMNIEKEMRIFNDNNEGIQKYILLQICSVDEKLVYEDIMYNNLISFNTLLNEKNILLNEIIELEKLL